MPTQPVTPSCCRPPSHRSAIFRPSRPPLLLQAAVVRPPADRRTGRPTACRSAQPILRFLFKTLPSLIRPLRSIIQDVFRPHPRSFPRSVQRGQSGVVGNCVLVRADAEGPDRAKQDSSRWHTSARRRQALVPGSPYRECASRRSCRGRRDHNV